MEDEGGRMKYVSRIIDLSLIALLVLAFWLAIGLSGCSMSPEQREKVSQRVEKATEVAEKVAPFLPPPWGAAAEGIAWALGGAGAMFGGNHVRKKLKNSEPGKIFGPAS